MADTYFLPAIVTTDKKHLDKLKEAEKIRITKVSLFFTGLNAEQREKFYEVLQRSTIREVPFAHLRSDTSPWEIDFLIRKYNTKKFNLHTQREYPITHNLSLYKDSLFLENTYYAYDEEELRNYSGLCLDFAHLEGQKKIKDNNYKFNMDIVARYPCGCAHVNGIAEKPFWNEIEKRFQHDTHFIHDKHELNYLSDYQQYIPAVSAMEVENTLSEQLEMIKYLQNFLRN